MIKLHGNVNDSVFENWKSTLSDASMRGWVAQDRLRKLEDKLAQTKNVWIEYDNVGKWQKYTSLPWTKSFLPDDFLKKLWCSSGCTRCLDFMVRRPTMGVGSLEPRFFFVGSAPGVGDGEQDYLDRTLVYGPTSHLLRDAIYDVDPTILDKSWFTNLMKMSFPNNRDGKSKDYEVCFDDLNTEIDSLHPTVIFAMGKSVWSFLKTKSIAARVIPLLHPSYFGRNYSTYKDLSFYFKNTILTEELI